MMTYYWIKMHNQNINRKETSVKAIMLCVGFMNSVAIQCLKVKYST